MVDDKAGIVISIGSAPNRVDVTLFPFEDPTHDMPGFETAFRPKVETPNP